MAAILGIILLLTFIAVFRKNSLPVEYSTLPSFTEVRVEGAVKQPGKVRVNAGSTLRDVMAQVEITSEADLKRLKLDTKVRHGQIIKVPAHKMIEVTITGAVENPGQYRLPSGTTVAELTKFVTFSPDANLPKIRKKRLKHGDAIEIPVIKT